MSIKDWPASERQREAADKGRAPPLGRTIAGCAIGPPMSAQRGEARARSSGHPGTWIMSALV
jgi:hypothetical protein